MLDLWTALFAVVYAAGLVITFIWGLVQFRTSEGWDRVGDRLWYARRRSARRMLLAPIWPIALGVATLALIASITLMAWFFLIRVIRVARGRA